MNQNISDQFGYLLTKIKSARLVLRQYQPADMAFIINSRASAEANGPFLSPEKISPQQFHQCLEHNIYWNVKSRSFIIALHQGALIGLIRYWQKSSDPTTISMQLQIVATSYRGQGLGTEAQIALIKRLFECTPYQNIEMHTALNNIGQQHCLDKMGFTLRKTEPYLDLQTTRTGHLYCLSKEQFRQLKVFA